MTSIDGDVHSGQDRVCVRFVGEFVPVEHRTQGSIARESLHPVISVSSGRRQTLFDNLRNGTETNKVRLHSSEGAPVLVDGCEELAHQR